MITYILHIVFAMVFLPYLSLYHYMLRLQRYRLSTDNNLNSLREVRVRSQEFVFWRLEESLNNEN